eukprot:7368839-Prymnesium_polylepis.1
MGGLTQLVESEDGAWHVVTRVAATQSDGHWTCSEESYLLICATHHCVCAPGLTPGMRKRESGRMSTCDQVTSMSVQ